MRFVGIREGNQIDLQIFHRIQSKRVSERASLICQIRSYCVEHGVAIRQGAGVLKVDLPRVLSDDGNDLTPRARLILRDLFDNLLQLEVRTKTISDEIKKIADSDE